MAKQLTQLSDIKVDELSFVPKAANKWKFHMFKGDAMKFNREIFKEILSAGLSDEEIEKILGSIEKAESDSPIEVWRQIDETGQMALKAALAILTEYSGYIPKDMLERITSFALGWSGPMMKANPDGTPPDGAGSSTKDGGERTMAEKALNGVPFKKEDGSWDYSKVAPESLPFFKEMIQSREVVEKENKRLSDELAKEKEERKLKEFDDKVRKEYAHVPGTKPEELAKMLYNLSKLDPESLIKMEAQLAATEKAMVEGNLLKEAGSSRTDESGGSVWTRIEAMASERMQKGDGKLTKEQAIGLIFKENPKLYSEYMSENPLKKVDDN